MENNDNNLKWYDNGYIITDIAIGLIFLIVILSQSFAINNNLSTLDIFTDIVNHNSVYLLILIYFVSLKINFGKKYFDYFNLFLIFVYFMVSLTSLLTIFQSFDLTSLLKLALNFVLLGYLFHTFLRDTRVWKEFKLNKSPFNELSNEWYFSAVIVLSIVILTVGLISATSIAGSILLFFDCLFNICLARYVFLYRDYLDSKKINVQNTGNLKKYRDAAEEIVNEANEKIEKFIDEKGIDEKIDDVKEKIVDTTKNAKEQALKYIEESNVDEKIDEIKEKVTSTTESTKKKVKDYVDKNKKIVDSEKKKEKTDKVVVEKIVKGDK